MLAALFVTTAWPHTARGAQREAITFVPSGVTVMVERASSPQQRELGLMHRRSMGETEGMLFCFEQPGYPSFWMYRTRIPLTVIFLDEALAIVDMQDMTPCEGKDPGDCRFYTARAPARYAIEVNQGFARRHGIRIGDHVAFGEKGGR
jgi:uncharacterized membrane protein (UPF0127 family)